MVMTELATAYWDRQRNVKIVPQLDSGVPPMEVLRLLHRHN
jgi:hypothetical protein